MSGRVRATYYCRASYRRQKANPYFNRQAIKVYWTTRDIIYRIGAFRARVYINSDISQSRNWNCNQLARDTNVAKFLPFEDI